ncbi:MAG: hypothetical protein K5864_07955 [Bacteroidales bacterium]|nr:hypothetical protein [Bacteroidales bacterium]
MKGLYSLRARVLRVGLLVAMFLIAGNQTAHSQIFDYAYAEDVNFTGLLEGSVIRGYGTSNAVVLFWDQGGQYFGYLVDGTAIYNAIDVPASLRIEDFQILGNEVYYCGWMAQGGAMVGRFDLNKLISGLPVSFDYKTFPQCSTYYLSRLAVANVSGDVSLMAIGSKDVPYSPVLSQVMYIPAYNSTSPNYVYEETMRHNQYGTIIPPPSIEERLFDVVTTDNYFAVIGCWEPSDNTLAVRKMQHGLPDLSGLGQIYTYTSTGGDAFIDYVRGISLEQDYIAVSSLYLTPTLQNSEGYTLVCTIDLGSPSTDMVYAQKFWIPRKANPFNMTYLKQYQRVVLTEPMFLNNNFNVAGFIYLDPFLSANYTAHAYYKDNRDGYYSVNPVGGNVLVASAGLSWFYLEHTLLNVPATCIKYYPKEVEKEHLIPRHYDSDPIPFNNNAQPFVLGTDGSFNSPRNMTNTCIEQ